MRQRLISFLWLDFVTKYLGSSLYSIPKLVLFLIKLQSDMWSTAKANDKANKRTKTYTYYGNYGKDRSRPVMDKDGKALTLRIKSKHHRNLMCVRATKLDFVPTSCQKTYKMVCRIKKDKRMYLVKVLCSIMVV